MIKLRCKTCGNEKEFVMLAEVALWNAEKGKWNNIEDGEEYMQCEICDSQHVSEVE